MWTNICAVFVLTSAAAITAYPFWQEEGNNESKARHFPNHRFPENPELIEVNGFENYREMLKASVQDNQKRNFGIAAGHGRLVDYNNKLLKKHNAQNIKSGMTDLLKHFG